MRECVEAVFAVVFAHAGFADAAKAHVRRSYMHYGIVYAASAEADCVQYIAHSSFVVGKKIEGERLISPGNKQFGVRYAFARYQREKRSENLLFHSRALGRAEQKRWRYFKREFVKCSAVYYFTFGH